MKFPRPEHSARTRLRTGFAASVMLVGSITAAGHAVAEPSNGIHYVALGDSFAAGGGILPIAEVSTCARSTVNYPALVARELGVATYTDASCSSASLPDLAAAQTAYGYAPPQFDKLTAAATLVTLTMGGNDIGLAELGLKCADILPGPYGRSCSDEVTAGGVDTLAVKLAALPAAYDSALEQIRTRAPRATVVIVGYPTAAREGGCPDQQPMRSRDIGYLQSGLDSLNMVLRTEADKHGAIFVDTAASSIGHDMCAEPDQQWINGIIPSLSTPSVAPLHPNVLGAQNMARQTVAALR